MALYVIPNQSYSYIKMNVYDVIQGGAAGIGLTLSAHPLDTLKTWKQTSTKVPNVNILKLYRGVAYPLAGQVFVNASLFGFYNYFTKVLPYEDSDIIGKNTFGRNIMAGSLAGVCSSIFVNPMELYKIRAQEKISLKCNPYKGLTSTIVREIPFYGLYYGVYYWSKENVFDEYRLAPLFAGGAAGFVSWLLTYPIDVLKTRIQSDMTLKNAIAKRNLYIGLSLGLTRAVIGNGAAFGCLEFAKSLIED